MFISFRLSKAKYFISILKRLLVRRLEDISAEDLVLTHATIMSGMSKIFKSPGVINSCNLRITCDIDACNIDTSTCIH